METTLQNGAAPAVVQPPSASAGVCYSPRFDIVETAEELTLYGDFPGVRPEDLDIRFENQELVVHGKVQPRQGDERRFEREYGIGDFYRKFAVSESIDPQKISAELKNGVLTLHLPKSEAVKPRKIQVRAE